MNHYDYFMGTQKGYIQDTIDTKTAMDQLERHIESIPVKLKQLSTADLLNRPAPGKWSKQEILGHLIDSAINNLQRFTEIQFSPRPYKVINYDQVNLVLVNDYQHQQLDQLLNLWQAINRQIVFVVRRLRPEELEYIVDPQYENKELKNFGWLICDYVAHMEHHFRQIFP